MRAASAWTSTPSASRRQTKRDEEGVTPVEFIRRPVRDRRPPATVVTLYLLPAINLRLRPQLWRELKSERASYRTFDMGTDWKPDKTLRLGNDWIYFWTIKDRAARSTLTPPC